DRYRSSLDVAATRGALPEPLDLARDGASLLHEELRDRVTQPWVADPVHAHRRRRVEAAQHLELAARPGLDAPQPVRDAVLDRGVVADVEMEERNVAHRSPVATVEDVALAHVERAGDHLAT